MEQYLKQGLAPDSKVLDIRQVDVSTDRFLEDNTPLYVITFTTQGVLLFRNRKTREVIVGAEDCVEQCKYAAAVTRVEELEIELTGVGKVIEVRRFRFPFISCQDGNDNWIDGTSVRMCISITESVLSDLARPGPSWILGCHQHRCPHWFVFKNYMSSHRTLFCCHHA